MQNVYILPVKIIAGRLEAPFEMLDFGQDAVVYFPAVWRISDSSPDATWCRTQTIPHIFSPHYPPLEYPP